MSKAFDSLHPPLMLSKLRAYGCDENALELLCSYLGDRSNRVKMGSTKSTWKLVNRGCPQGSALGPLLWNIFQNDLTYDIPSQMSMYADDHQLYETDEDLQVVEEKLAMNAEKASQWYTNNLLKENYDKYKTMTIHKNHTAGEDICLQIQGHNVKSVESLKLLGVTIDYRMNFNEHINNVCKKASQRIGVLMRLKNLIPTTILPYLIYCHLTWHFCKASDTRKLERIQERGLRAVFKDKQSAYEDLLRRANLPTLLNRRLQDIAILMFKVKHELCPQGISKLFNRHSSQYNLRSADFTIPRFNTITYGKHCINYLGPKLWNKLSSEIRNLPSLNQFKKIIRNFNVQSLLDENSCTNCMLCNS
jgi:hypothetical protein